MSDYRTDKGLYSEAEMNRRIAEVVARERGSYGDVTVRFVAPKPVEKADRKRLGKTFRKGNKDRATLEDRVARERRVTRVRLEMERRQQALLDQFGGMDDDSTEEAAA